jgi:hypothetical protein
MEWFTYLFLPGEEMHWCTGEHRCSKNIISSCSTICTRRLTFINENELGKERIVITTNNAYVTYGDTDIP